MSANPKKPAIAFFGTPDFAVWALDALKEKGILPDLVIAAPDAPKGRGLALTPPPTKVWAEQNGVRISQPHEVKSPEFESELKKLCPGDAGWDLFIVAAYGKIIPENILYMPRRKTINVHPSLLPALRGSSPLQTAIVKDMRDTGVTIMRLDREMDHGPILAQEKAMIEKWPIDQQALGSILARQGGHMIARILPDILSEAIPEREQDHTAATYTQKISKTDGEIDLSGDPYKNFLRFNAYKGWPGSYFFADMGGKRTRVTITAARFENSRFIIEKAIPEGKKEMAWSDFN